jgi:hypothetical protein
LDFDLFVSHASEDKERFVRPLVHALTEKHLAVWFDEHELRPGDSLIRSVEHGLARSRFAIVVLSPAFFEKRWPRAELDALATRELATGDSVLLPIWLDVGADDVREFSPLLGDRFAIIGSRGIEYAANAISRRIRPGQSPLVLAREELADRGISTPPPSDTWWLDAVEAAAEPADAPHSGLYRWGFPLPEVDESAKARGRRLAQATLRDAWKWEAQERPITQITPPDIVHAFIEEMPGLSETCMEHPEYLGSYAPQLLIPGFGGRFEGRFDEWLEAAKARNDLDTVRWHLKAYDSEKASRLACDFVQGELFGPEVKFFAHIDYFFWALSDSSNWLPAHAKQVLVKGLCDWGVWPTDAGRARRDEGDALLELLFDASEVNGEPPNEADVRKCIANLARTSIEVLGLTEDADELADRLIKTQAVEIFIDDRRAKVERNG